MLPYGELRAAVAAASEPLHREIQALVHSCCVSHCALLQAAFARMLPRLLSSSASMGNWLLRPILWDLQELIGKGKTHLQARTFYFRRSANTSSTLNIVEQQMHLHQPTMKSNCCSY